MGVLADDRTAVLGGTDLLRVLVPAPRSPLVLAPLPEPPPPARRSWQAAARPRLGGALPVVRERTRQGRSTVVDHLLTVLALVGLAVTGLTVFATVSGLRPLVVRSGSMEPLIRTGGMVLVERVQAGEIRVGDVVAVERPDGVRVTHRVVSLTPEGTAVQLVLKGDANDAADPDPVVVTEAGRLVWTAPVVGRLSAELASARGGFLLGCLVTAGVLSALRRPSPP